ncbi:energy-coupling factor transporter transmembrane component T [Streptomyces shenzhenensis]|uniref:energy-coupling factor transporter transmembrane component T n=1 Tax=Streptomyces shenzhenensis TaxID=943815 RepID=UPI003D949024
MSTSTQSVGRRPQLAALNPVAKLAAVLPAVVLVLFTRDIATPAVIVIAAALVIIVGARLRPRAILIGGAIILLAGAWTTASFALLTRPEVVAGTPVVIDGWITLHAGALCTGMATSLRLIAMMLLALVGSLGTTTSALVSALVRQGRVPYRFAYGAVAAVRFAPRYRQDLLTIRAAQRARGIIDRRGPVGYLTRTRRSLIPLLAGGARHAERLSLAMDARGFGAHPHRNDRHPAVLRPSDVLFIFAVWSGVAAIFVITNALGLLTFGTGMAGPGW